MISTYLLRWSRYFANLDKSESTPLGRRLTIGRLGCWLGLSLLFMFLWPSQFAHAHGGTLIASGSSPSGQHGWMLSISPFPVVTGPATLSLLVFDSKSSAIVNNVTGELYLAAPATPRPCCKPGVHLGPFPLLLEPFQFGDYIAYVPVDAAGQWEVQFRLTVGADTFTIVAPFAVEAEGGLDQAAIQAAVDELTESTRSQLLQAPQPASPLALTTTITNAVQQARSPLASPLATPAQPAAPLPATATAGPTIVASRANWLVASGVGAIVVGVLLLWWRTRKKS